MFLQLINAEVGHIAVYFLEEKKDSKNTTTANRLTSTNCFDQLNLSLFQCKKNGRKETQNWVKQAQQGLPK